jgi:hypothetical protein
MADAVKPKSFLTAGWLGWHDQHSDFKKTDGRRRRQLLFEELFATREKVFSVFSFFLYLPS